MRGERTKVVGMAGGVASGKSAVASLFGELGAKIIDADMLGHEALKDPDVKQALRERWGPEILDPRGEVDRGSVARIVFDDEAAREFLTDLVHPRIRQRIRARMDGWRQDPDAPLVVLDAPLVFEGELEEWCDLVVFVDAGRHVREGRARRRLGWDAAEMTRRESAQMSPDEKKRRSDVVIDNGGSLEQTRRQVKALFDRLVPGVQEADGGPHGY